MEKGQGDKWRFVLFLFLLGAGALLALMPQSRAFFALEHLRVLVLSWGWWAVVAYLVCAVVLPFLWTPRSVLIVLAGVLFGRWLGAAVAWVGSLLSAALAFLFARYLAQRKVWKILEDKGIRTDGVSEGELLRLIFLARICPIAHAELTCYLAGVSRVGLGSFLLVSAFGYVPNTVAWVILGDTVANSMTATPASWVLLYLGIATLLTFGAMGRALTKVRMTPPQKQKDDLILGR